MFLICHASFSRSRKSFARSMIRDSHLAEIW